MGNLKGRNLGKRRNQSLRDRGIGGACLVCGSRCDVPVVGRSICIYGDGRDSDSDSDRVDIYIMYLKGIILYLVESSGSHTLDAADSRSYTACLKDLHEAGPHGFLQHPAELHAI